MTEYPRMRRAAAGYDEPTEESNALVSLLPQPGRDCVKPGNDERGG
jgi:hypothetical protein